MSGKMPQLIKGKQGISGYESGAIGRYFKTKGQRKEWNAFMNGQTGAIIGGKFIVYKWDVERFIAGLPNID